MREALAGPSRRRRHPLVVVLTLATVIATALMLTLTAWRDGAPSAAASVKAGKAGSLRMIGDTCARNPAALLRPSEVSPGLIATMRLSERSPEITAFTAGHAASALAPYLWFQDVNAQIRQTPATFGPFGQFALAAAHPQWIVREAQTIQAFPTVLAASGFAGRFRPSGGETHISGPLSGLTVHVVFSGPPGDRTLALGSHVTGPRFPGDVQFVIQRGTVVMTLELTGGSALTPASELRVDDKAQQQLAAACPALAR
jgi:hypothetical protein